MSTAEATAPKQRGIPFKPGQSGNPAGRPKGSRNRLTEDFLRDLANAWQTHGEAALEACAKAEPAKFCTIVAGLLPRNVHVEGHVDVLADVTDALVAFGKLTDMLGAEPKLGARRMRRLMVIEHDPEG